MGLSTYTCDIHQHCGCLTVLANKLRLSDCNYPADTRITKQARHESMVPSGGKTEHIMQTSTVSSTAGVRSVAQQSLH